MPVSPTPIPVYDGTFKKVSFRTVAYLGLPGNQLTTLDRDRLVPNPPAEPEEE
jgi:hypothetical protein